MSVPVVLVYILGRSVELLLRQARDEVFYDGHALLTVKPQVRRQVRPAVATVATLTSIVFVVVAGQLFLVAVALAPDPWQDVAAAAIAGAVLVPLLSKMSLRTERALKRQVQAQPADVIGDLARRPHAPKHSGRTLINAYLNSGLSPAVAGVATEALWAGVYQHTPLRRTPIASGRVPVFWTKGRIIVHS